MDSPAHQRRTIIDYFVDQSPQGTEVHHAEKVASERIYGIKHDVWDEQSSDGRWWVITNPTNLYPQEMTLAALYNSLRDPGRNPLRALQERLDEAVARLYGFDPNDALTHLLALNQSIAAEEAAGITQPRPPGSGGMAGATTTTLCIEPPPNWPA